MSCLDTPTIELVVATAHSWDLDSIEDVRVRLLSLKITWLVVRCWPVCQGWDNLPLLLIIIVPHVCIHRHYQNWCSDIRDTCCNSCIRTMPRLMPKLSSFHFWWKFWSIRKLDCLLLSWAGHHLHSPSSEVMITNVQNKGICGRLKRVAPSLMSQVVTNKIGKLSVELSSVIKGRFLLKLILNDIVFQHIGLRLRNLRVTEAANLWW